MKYLIISLLSFSMTTMSCKDSSDEIVVTETNPIIAQIANLPKEPVSDAERDAMLLMREEEKLARDVYNYLEDVWSAYVFSNISSSEQTHMDAMLALLNKYELEDPVGDDVPGKFVNQDLQKLYDELIEAGAKRVGDAYRVGAAIEEIDILDLKRELDETVDNQDITIVFENLMKGSRNHLRAFVRNLESIGETYTPQYLSQEDYDAIINSEMERGGRSGRRRWN